MKKLLAEIRALECRLAIKTNPLFKTDKSGLRVIDWVLRFITTRHNGNQEGSYEAYKYLKKALGNDYAKILSKHGDPDAPKKYESVLRAWRAEANEGSTTEVD
jgi:hypothetical protein